LRINKNDKYSLSFKEMSSTAAQGRGDFKKTLLLTSSQREEELPNL